MSARLRRLLLAGAFLFVLWQIWSRVHFVILGGLGDLLVLLAVFALAFVALDHYLTHARD